jgi:hypothetical protein
MITNKAKYKNICQILSISILLSACRHFDSSHRNNVQVIDSIDNRIDSGKYEFSEHCVSCHNITKKDGFVWPSVLELSQIDTSHRNALWRNFLKDSIHTKIKNAINQNKIELIRFFINHQTKNNSKLKSPS